MKLSTSYKAFIAAIAMSVGLLSCVKKDYQPIEISGLSIIQASPTTEKLDVYVDNNRATSDFSFGNKIDYLNAYSGNRKLDLAKKGSDVSLTSERVNLVPSVGYSLFIVDKLENVKFLLLKDDLTTPAPGKATVRFVNLSPDSAPLNLAIEGKPSNLVSNKAFKEYSNFEVIDVADKVTFVVKNTATGVTETTLADVKIEDRKIYTIYVKGLKSATDDMKLGAAIFTHK